MTDLVLTTYDWVPDMPRGFVRDLRVRWALEEAALPYRVESTPFHDRGADHFAHQPFGQVPWLADGGRTLFESGAILLYLGGKSEALMPVDPEGRLTVTEWVFAALNSVEMAVLPWALFKFTGDTGEGPGAQLLQSFVQGRVQHMDKVLTGREWLTERFSIADLLMADVLRLAGRFDGLADAPACGDYVKRATARPAFKKAYDDQMAHFAAADAAQDNST